MLALRWTVRLGLPAVVVALSACWLFGPWCLTSPGTASPKHGTSTTPLSDLSGQDPLLVSRVTARFPRLASDVAGQFGQGGLVALDQFGAPAAALFDESPRCSLASRP